MFKEQVVKQSEWKGQEEHEDDILATAVMKSSPLLLATASFDGDIVLWNSVTEIPSKHLKGRKKTSEKSPMLKKENTSASMKGSVKASRLLSRRSTKADTAIDPDVS